MIKGRPDLPCNNGGNHSWGHTIAKSKVKYVFGAKLGALVHEVKHVELCWWAITHGGHALTRMKSPHIHYITKCGASWPADGTGTRRKATVCQLPAADAVLCNKCQGQGVNFSRTKEGYAAIKAARKVIGCAVELEG